MAYRHEFDKVVALLQEAESLAHHSGLHSTGHAINAAKNRAGWEFAGVHPSEGERLHNQYDGNGRDRRNGGF